MAYATLAKVSSITEIPEVQIDSTFLTLADNYVEMLLNRSFESTETATDIYDIPDRNVYYEGSQSPYIFPLNNSPLISVQSVYLDDVLQTVDTDYWIDYGSYSIKFNSEEIDDDELPWGQRKVKISYTYGYSSAPAIIVDFASFIAAHMVDSTTALQKSDSGSILSEVEIGRYREKYANPASFLEGKYGKILGQMQEAIIDKYKLWD